MCGALQLFSLVHVMFIEVTVSRSAGGCANHHPRAMI